MTSRKPQPRPKLQRLLDHCDKLESIRDGFERARGESARGRFRQQKSRVREQLARLLASPPRLLAETLLDAESDYGFDDNEAVLLVTLLHQRIRHSDYCLSGRELLWVLADSTYDLFQAVRYITPESKLVSSGAVSVLVDPEDEADDALNHHYILSPSVYRQLCRRQAKGEGGPALEPIPYADGTDFLLDVGGLSEVCQRRAAKVFEYGYWRELHGEPFESAAALDRRLDGVRGTILRRLQASPDSEHFELRRFQADHGLSELEVIIVVTLLWQETIAGVPSLDVVDLVRLVSASKRDLLRKRRLLSPGSALISSEIVVLDDIYAEKSLTGHAYLSEWVTDALVDASFRTDRAIASDERIEFHHYLSRLRGSDDFFEKL